MVLDYDKCWKNNIYVQKSEREEKNPNFTNQKFLDQICHSFILPSYTIFAGPKEAFKFLSVRPSVRPSIRLSPIGSVESYSVNIPQSPNIFTESGPPINYKSRKVVLLATFGYFWLPFGDFWLLLATFGYFWLVLATVR